MSFRKRSHSAPPSPLLSQATSLSRPEPVPNLPSPQSPALPHEERTEPLRALKAAFITVGSTFNGLAFTPLNREFSAYGAQAAATCHCRGTYSLSGSYVGGITYTMTSSLGYSSGSGGGGGYVGGGGGGGYTLEPPPLPVSHSRPEPDSSCGFYAWRPGAPFPWQPGTWLLETDLYGHVVEHESGYRAQKQRVLSVSPVLGVLCSPPFTLALARDTNEIRAFCEGCTERRGHMVSVDRLRQMLGVEIDLHRAMNMRTSDGFSPERRGA
jgi:hypothetical protein